MQERKRGVGGLKRHRAVVDYWVRTFLMKRPRQASTLRWPLRSGFIRWAPMDRDVFASSTTALDFRIGILRMPVNRDDLAGNEPRGRRRQEHCHRGNVFSCYEAAHRGT